MQLHHTVCSLLGLDREVATLGSVENQQPLDCRPLAEPSTAAGTLQRYYQVFEQRNGFLPHLSIADLLFNMGPEGLITLRDSAECLDGANTDDYES